MEPINCHVLAGSLEHPQEPDYKGEELQPPGADQSPPPGGQKPGEAETPLFPFADGPPSGSATSWLLPTSPGSFSFGSGISSCGASPQPGLENHGQHDEAPTPWLTHKYKQTSPTSPALPSCSQFLPVSWRSRAPKGQQPTAVCALSHR